MKLVEIKDVRPGQIRKVTAFNQWKDEEEFEVLAVIEASGLGEYAEFDTYAEFYDIKTKQLMEDDSEELRFYENGELIGKLGITHRTEDGKLVEIPRTAEFQIDDVCYTLSFYNTASPHFDIGVDFEDIIFVIDNMDTYENGTLLLFDARGNEYRPDDVEKIGILGVTHEFVNDREAANE